MSSEDRDVTGSQPVPPDKLDRGMAEAFEKQTPATGMSVLRALQARTKSKLGVHLDSQGLDDVLVKVTDEARKLKDPSGRYQVLGEIGRGGVGTVYKGRDHDLGRDVAMKVLRDEFAGRPDVLARFVEEAQIGGQLQHPGIVPVYELGLQAGERPYFAMKLVKGETLASQLARREDPARNRRRLLGVFEQVCQTVAYAHARRVVHRDLKPANVMIGAFGEVQVVDWGFAKVLAKGGVTDEAESVARASERSVIETVRSRAESGSGSVSVAGSMLGTPAYMPPEQALGDIVRVDQRSDVFALGAILCEILTGEPPYREQDGDLVRQAANARLDGANARLARCGADAALVQLCTECLSPSRRARPESAQEVADRVGGYLTSVEERARKAEVHAAEVRFRHRVITMAAAAALVLTSLGAGTWILLQHEAQARRAEVTQQVANQMNTTSRALGMAQAQDGVIDVALWDAADRSAASLALVLESDDIENDVRAEAEALLAKEKEESRLARDRAKQHRHDREMVARLDQLLIPTDDDLRVEEWERRELKRLDVGYVAAFAAYLAGRSVFELPADEAVAALRGELDIELAVAIDRWGLVRDWRDSLGEDVDAGRTQHVRRIAARLDTAEPWRVRLRALLPRAVEEGALLRRLGDEAIERQRSAAEYRVLALALQRAGEPGAALRVLEAARRAHPSDFGLTVALGLGYELAETPRWEDAQETYEIANALDPRHQEVLHRRGLALEKLGRHADAERCFRRLVALAPEDAHWVRHLAGSLMHQRKLDEALEVSDRALAIDEADATTHKVAGVIRYEMGHLRHAEEHYRRAIDLGDGTDGEVYNNLGNVLRRSGQPAQAVEWYHKAIDTASHVPMFHGNLGRTLVELGELDEALTELGRARVLCGSDVQHLDTLLSVAHCLARSGEYEEALEVFDDAIALKPESARSYNEKASVLSRMGQYEKAVEAMKAALARDDGEGDFWFNYAGNLSKMGRVEEAIDAYRSAISRNRDDWQARTYLGKLLIESGEREHGLEQLAAALRTDGRSWLDVTSWLPSHGLHREAVTLGEQLSGHLPEAAEGNGRVRYNLARTAAWLVRSSSPGPDDAERARLRGLARSWLTEVARHAKPVVLQRALADPVFAAVRGEALDPLPEGERAAWHALWERIEQAAKEDGR